MTNIKLIQRFTAVFLVLLLMLSIIPASAFAAEPTDPTADTNEEDTSEPTVESTEPEITVSDDGIMPLATGDSVTITSDHTRQIQWIGHSDARLTISYTDAQGTTHSGWMTAINKYLADGVYAYCIEPAVELGTSYTEDQATAAWATQLTADQRSAIALALAYGYPAQEFPAADPAGVAADRSLEYPLRTDLWQESEKYAATQIIIWEILMGKRSAVPPYDCTDSSLFESFYRISNPYGYRADWNTLKLTYDTISASLASVNKIPSFSNASADAAPIYDLIYDTASGTYTTTLTDSNSVLASYDFSTTISGVTITRSGNQLTITATPEAAAKLDGTVLCSAEGASISVDPNAAVAVWSPNGEGQTVITLRAEPEPIHAYFKLRANVNGGLEIIKTSSSGNVAGFEFRVQGNGIDQTVYSDASGKINVTDLEDGTYTVTEILPADSAYYCTSPNPQTVSVETGKTATVTFNNEPKQWQVTVYKEDAETGEAQADATLDGAVYGLYRGDTLVKEYTVQNGTFTTDAYPCGTGYTLKEISAPPGYQLDTDVYDLKDYSAPGNCTGPLTTSQVTVLEDVIKGQFEIIKQTLNPVSNATAPEGGAKFRYYLKSTGNYDACPDDQKGELTTGDNGIGKSKELPYGTYVVEQISGTAGTDLAASFEVVVSEHGEIYSFTKDNPYWTGSVSIYKVDSGTSTPLVATFQLLDSEQNLLETGTTGTDGMLTFATILVYGQTYYIQETAAPEGYELDETLYPVTVESRNQDILLTRDNSPSDGSISIQKVDTEGNKLSGVSFCLEYSTDGQSWSVVTHREAGSTVTVGGCTSTNLSNGCLTTDDSGKAVFSGLRTSGTNGTIYYRLSEVSTKDGKTLMLEPVFEGELSAESGRDITITAVNSGVFEIPLTGSHSLLLLRVCQILFTSGGLILLSRRKEWM